MPNSTVVTPILDGRRAGAAEQSKREVSIGNAASASAVAGNFRNVESAVTLLASGARTASASETDVASDLLKAASALAIVLDVTAQSGTTPLLDVAIQVKYGGFYTNLVRFAQLGAATGAFLVIVKRDIALAAIQTLAADPAVGTGALNNDGLSWLDTLRVKYTIAGTTPSYTFSVVAYPVN